jgi:hypothetical protein
VAGATQFQTKIFPLPEQQRCAKHTR